MANLNSKPLETNDLFPALSVRLVDGDEVSVPDCLGPEYGVLLFYRGSW